MDNEKPTTSEAKPNENNQIITEKITKNGETTIKKYTRGRLLGKGGFAKCYEFTNLESKKLYAAKIIPKSSMTKSRAK